MASSGTTTTQSIVTLGNTGNEVVTDNEDDSTGVGIIHWDGGLVDVLATSISDREDISCSATISLVDADIGFWLDEEIPTNGTEEGGGAGGVEVKNLGQG